MASKMSPETKAENHARLLAAIDRPWVVKFNYFTDSQGNKRPWNAGIQSDPPYRYISKTGTQRNRFLIAGYPQALLERIVADHNRAQAGAL
jgi:hypothetical protein